MDGWISVVVKVQTRILQAISEWKRFAEWKEFGIAVTVSFSLFVTANMFQEAGWSECWCTRTIHAVRTLGVRGDCDAQQSSCIRVGGWWSE